jgi:protein O-mannosyl-transferase
MGTTLKNSAAGMALGAGIICLLVYLRALGNDFVGLDDPIYVVENVTIRNLDGNTLVSAFTQLFAGDYWMPLTWISFAVDYRLWGLNPLGYHLTNILLHAANAGLVVLIADGLCREKFSGGGAGPGQKRLYQVMLLLAGLLFGLHPLRVESVAWVTERKDVLNGLFSLGALLCYLNYARKKDGEEGGAVPAYLLSLVLFICSLMAKPVSVTLPVMLLVADWYPLERFRKGRVLPLLLEKVPFFAISAALAALTLYFKSQQAMLASTGDFPISLRLLVSGNALFHYVKLFLFPVGIVPYHVLAKTIPPAFVATTAAAALFLVGCACAGKKRPAIPAALLGFLLPLLPTLPLIPYGGDIAYAERFTYLPSAIPSIAAAAGIALAYRSRTGDTRPGVRRAVTAAVVVLLLFYTGMSVRLIDVWKNTGNLWTRILAVEPVGRAYKERGLYYLQHGEYRAALDDLTTAIGIAEKMGRTDTYNLYAFRGEALASSGRYDEAVRDLTAAIASSPRPLYFFHRGLAWKALGKSREADEDFARAGGETGPLVWFEE